MASNQETLVSASEVMRRVRMRLGVGEINTSSAASSSVAEIEISASAFVVPPPTTDFPIKAQYVVADFLGYDDVAFVVNAYRAILHRDPDPDARSYLEQLRSSTMTKVEVLGALRWSAEGRNRGTHIDGLLLPFKLHQWRRLPLLGGLLHWAHSLGRLHRNARAMETHIELVNGDLQYLQGLVAKVATEQASKLQSQELAIESLPTKAAVDELSRQIEVLAQQVTEQTSRLQSQQEAIESRLTISSFDQLSGRVDGLSRQIVELSQQISPLSEQVAELQAVPQLPSVPAVARASGEANATIGMAHNADASAVDGHLDLLYADFENQFRGPQHEIRARLEPYLKFIGDVGAGSASSPILDLGCGRGEWLELLREAGLQASGVDLNSVFIRKCLSKHLDVQYGDAISKLKSLPDASVGVVSLFHLAEHLGFNTLIELLDQARRVLVPGGGLIMETPNPENARVAQWTFYMDPTHRNPLPPQMLRWMVQARGFVQSDIQPLFAARPAPSIAFVADDVPGASTINALVEPFHESLDYAIVARKSVALA